MLKVHYEHPPRNWKFYAGYTLQLALLLSPVALLFITWFDPLPLGANLLCVALLTSLFLIFAGRFSLEQFVMDFDLGLEKSTDISHEFPTPPENIETGIQQLGALGFSRIGESSTLIAFNEEGKTTWYLQAEAGAVLAEIVDIEGITPYFVRFSSWFAGQELVETYYPLGDSLKYADYRCEGINTSLEAAFMFHMRELADFEARFGAPIEQKSIQQIMALDQINKEKYAPRLYQKVRIRNFASIMAILLIIAATIYWFGYDFAAIYADTRLNSADLAQTLSLIYGGLGFLMLAFVQMPSRDISQAKKKAA